MRERESGREGVTEGARHGGCDPREGFRERLGLLRRDRVQREGEDGLTTLMVKLGGVTYTGLAGVGWTRLAWKEDGGGCEEGGVRERGSEGGGHSCVWGFGVGVWELGFRV